ncbi:hypothetical protein JC221_086 [Yersinia phage JC221]|nr:hypothetical protein JC221_086 [Yersinia phage JC221]
MSVNHKLFVACDTSKAIDVYSHVMMYIKRLYRQKIEDLVKEYGDYYNIPSEIREKLRVPRAHTYDFEAVAVCFGLGGEPRKLFMSHVCSCDHKEFYDGQKIVFSIGSGGEHVEIMNAVKECLIQHGDVWECDEAVSYQFVKVEK